MPGPLPVEAPELHRQCGRCRRSFPAEAGTDPRLLREWWACPPCHAALFPPKTATPTARTTADG